MNKLRPQIPSSPDNWLHNGGQDHERIFSKLVYLGVNAHEWVECTTEEKEQWESKYPQPEPIEPPAEE